MSLKGLHFVRKLRPGRTIKWYVYAWRGGPCIATRECVRQPKLTVEEVKRAGDTIEQANRPDPKRLMALIREWRASPEWTALADGTKKTWGHALNVIEEKWGLTPLSIWNDPRMVAKVVAWRDSRAETPRTADIGITVLRELLKFGRLRARVTINVAVDIPTLYRGGNRAEIIWTDEDMDRFAWQAVKLERPQLIDGLWLAALTGMRRADLVTVTGAQVYDYAIVKKALKVSKRKRRTATMPRIPELDSLLDELGSRFRAPGVETVLVNSRGLPWSADGFGGSFNRIRDEAEIAHVDPETGKRRAKHLHDLRGTFCTRLILAGLTDEEAAGVMGWSPQQVADIRHVYVDQSRVVVAIGERISGRNIRASVNPIVNRLGGGDEN